jgi:hypothetical protein
MRAAHTEGRADALTGSPPNPLYKPRSPYQHWAYLAGYNEARPVTADTPGVTAPAASDDDHATPPS